MISILCCGLMCIVLLILAVQFCFFALALYRYYHEEEQDWTYEMHDSEEMMNEWNVTTMEDWLW